MKSKRRLRKECKMLQRIIDIPIHTILTWSAKRHFKTSSTGDENASTTRATSFPGSTPLSRWRQKNCEVPVWVGSVRDPEREPEGGPKRGPHFVYNWIAERARKKGWFLIGYTAKDDEDESRRKSSFSSRLLPSPLPLGMPATNCFESFCQW